MSLVLKIHDFEVESFLLKCDKALSFHRHSDVCMSTWKLVFKIAFVPEIRQLAIKQPVFTGLN